MNKSLLALLFVSLTGCVVVPAEPVVYGEVYYPVREAEYMWEPTMHVFFFFDGRMHRHYMPRGWRYGDPHPRGH